MMLAGLTSFTFGQQSPGIYWRFANPSVYQEGNDSFLQFDIEISCDRNNTFHSDLQVYLDYNPEAFGENIVASGNVSVEKLGLLKGDVSGAAKYVQLPLGVPGADNKSNRHACLTEALFRIPNGNFMNEVPVLPEWGSLFRYRIRIENNTEKAGISFVSADTKGTPLMDEGQYFLNRNFMSPEKYGRGTGFEGLYENSLVEFPLIPTGEKTGDISAIRIYSEGSTVFVRTGDVSGYQMRLYDIFGKALIDTELSGSTEYEIPAWVTKGIYIAEVTDGTQVTTQKIYLSR